MRINNKKDLPKWFSLEAYRIFSTLDDNDFSNQMIYRVFDAFDGYDGDDSYFGNVLKKSFAMHDDPNFIDLDADFSRFVGPHAALVDDIAVTPLRVTDVYHMYHLLERHKSLPLKKHERYIESRLHNTSYDIPVREFQPESIHCAVDLGCSDEIILASLKKILPIWRSQMNVTVKIGGECPVKTSWPVNRQKIISYNAFAFYDLMRWQKATGNKITNSVLAAALYPNGEYGEMAITQTIKDYVEKIFSKKYIDFLLTKRHENGVEPILE